MTSEKSKQERLEKSRLKRAKALTGIDTRDENITPPPGAVMADQAELVHNNTYDRFPRFYVDKVIVCRDCGKEEVWAAERQKWWYEVAKGNINTQAIRCRECRAKRKSSKRRSQTSPFRGFGNKIRKQ
jgi:hypothetical protein